MRIAIIGAGASGLICAVSAAEKAQKNNIDVTIDLFEAKDKPGKKILATGNGRCNLMNYNSIPAYFDKNNFSAYAIEKFDVQNNLDFFASLGLYTRSDEEGRIYPLSNQATSVLDTLRFACESRKVNIICDSTINTISTTQKGFLLNDKIIYDKIVLACGGKAAVKNHNGYELLKMTGHKVTDIYPSLTKLEVKNTKIVKQLKGIRQKGKFTLAENGKYICAETGELLFTDYGISGIAVMQLSAYITRCKYIENFTVTADFVCEFSYSELFDAIKRTVTLNPMLKNENLLSGFVAKRLGEVIIKNLGLSLSDTVSKLTDKNIKAITNALKKFTFEISGVKGFDDAQVTAGGADTSFFNNKTMESNKIKGLYCIGELLDVDALCGGYNLHWAWSSGRLCAESLISDRKG